MSLRRGLALLFGCCLSSSGYAEIFEGFESKLYWQVAPWGDEAKSGISKERVSEGQTSLEVYFGPEMKQQKKGVVIERDLSNFSEEFNKLTIDVFNEGPAKISVALAVETDEYFESVALPLEKGWNKGLSYFLDGHMFKSKSSNWQYESSVNLKSPLKKIYLIFYRNDAPEGRFFIDHIEVTREIAPSIARAISGETSGKHEVERSKKYHYRPKGLPIEIFTR